MEVLNNLLWLDLLRNNLENAAEKAYRIHKLDHKQDYKYIFNKKLSIAVDQSTLIKDNFPINTNGFDRPVPLGVENAELNIFRFTDEPIVDTVKQTIGLDHCLVVYNLQKPGKVYNTHIDYNRRFIKQLPDTIAKTVKAKDIKKYI